MCISFENVDDKMVKWGSWHWHNAGYGANLGYTSDGKMHRDHLATAACGGGNKVEHFEEMPEDIKLTDDELRRLSPEQRLLCKWLFVDMANDSQRQRISYTKLQFTRKYKKSVNYFRTRKEALYNKLSALLDDEKIDSYQWMREKTGLHAPT